MAKNLKIIQDEKKFFYKDLEKNIYLYDKKHLIDLNIINFVINPKVKIRDFSFILKKILKAKIRKFNIDGKYLIDCGMQQGVIMGRVLKKIEEEWIKNNFEISKEKIKEIIHSQSI